MAAKVKRMVRLFMGEVSDAIAVLRGERKDAGAVHQDGSATAQRRHTACHLPEAADATAIGRRTGSGHETFTKLTLTWIMRFAGRPTRVLADSHRHSGSFSHG